MCVCVRACVCAGGGGAFSGGAVFQCSGRGVLESGGGGC